MYLPLTKVYFGIDKKNKNGLSCWCRECKGKYMKKYQRDNKEKVYLTAKNCYEKSKSSGKWGKCKDCGRNLASNSRRKTLVCRKCYRGKNHVEWRGGKIGAGDGYIKIYKPDHPFVVNKKYVLEHRLVIEKKIGRYLTANETVHHKNGVRSDNRLENLELRINSHPYGITIPDAIKWAKEILRIYGED